MFKKDPGVSFFLQGRINGEINMKTLFRLGKKYHGMGKVHVAWQTEGNFLATAGKNGKNKIIQYTKNHIQLKFSL